MNKEQMPKKGELFVFEKSGIFNEQIGLFTKYWLYPWKEVISYLRTTQDIDDGIIALCELFTLIIPDPLSHLIYGLANWHRQAVELDGWLRTSLAENCKLGLFFPENKSPIWKWIFIVQEVLLKQEDLFEMRKRDDAEEKSRSFWLISKYFHNVYRSGNFLGALSRLKSECDTSRLDFKMGTILLQRTNDDDV